MRAYLTLIVVLLAGCELPGSPVDPNRCRSSDTGCDLDGDGVLDPDDCNPLDPGVFPGAEDAPFDGVNSNCDGDLDDDGHLDGDCDPEDPDIYPGAPDELFDGVDSDCDLDHDDDGHVEDDCDPQSADVYPGAPDPAGDGVNADCGEDPDDDGYTAEQGDCDEGSATTYPGAADEPGDGIDSACDGDVDDDGVFPEQGDCDDEDPLTYPGAPDAAGDGIDADCDGDADDDGWTTLQGDCDDNNAAYNPGADDQDDDAGDLDCDGDADEDGYDALEGDCDDDDPAVHPWAGDEPGDGLDTNCDGDADDDGWTVEDGDCDDLDAAVNPEAADEVGEPDTDCDGDLDEDGVTVADGDCDDTDPDVHPYGDDDPTDEVDGDCDGDLDEDGYAPAGGDCDDADPDTYPFAFDLVNDGQNTNCSPEEDLIYTAAGTGQLGFAEDGTPASVGAIQDVQRILVDDSGVVYFTNVDSERTHSTVRVIDGNGTLWTLAGGGTESDCDGMIATECSFNTPGGIALGLDGSFYVADTWSGRIWQLTYYRREWYAVRLAGVGGVGAPTWDVDATESKLPPVSGLGVGPDGSVYATAYYDDGTYHLVMRIDPDGILRRFAGSGPAGAGAAGIPAVDAALYYPRDVVVTSDGRVIFSDKGNARILTVDEAGLLQVLFPREGASYYPMYGLGLDALDQLYVAVPYLSGVYRLEGDPQQGYGSPVVIAGKNPPNWEDPDAGDGGPSYWASLNFPTDVAVAPWGQVWIADTDNVKIRTIFP